MQELAQAEARRPFELAAGAAVAALQLLRLGEQRHGGAAEYAPHHQRRLVRPACWRCASLATLYRAFAQGQPSPLPDLPVQYADYAVWQRHWLQGERLQSQLAFWKQRLSGLAPLESPSDRPRPAVPTFPRRPRCR